MLRKEIKEKGIEDESSEVFNQRLEQFQEEVEEEYPKHTDPKKQQPGKNVITPIIEYAKLYDSYLRDRKNPKVMGYKRYEYIHNNFEYLTGIRIHDLYNEDMAGLIENRKTARRAEIDSIIEEVGPHAFAQFILDKLQEFFPERNYNRTIKPLTEYFADKFDILPESIKKFFMHVTTVADAAAKPTELKQKAVQGLPNVSNTKEANKQRISEAVAQNAEMKTLDSKGSSNK